MVPVRAAWLQIQGKDASDFLQRLSTVDARQLSEKESRPGCFLDPTGKIQSFFYLHKSDVQTYVFELEVESTNAQLQGLKAFIEKFHFAEQFTLQEMTALPPGLTTRIVSDPKTRVDQMIPAVPNEIGPTVNPLEVGLRAAVAEQKGCYPGQEVIEKIISLGAPARRLVRVETETEIIVLGPIYSAVDQKTEVGIVTTAQNRRGLAIVRKTHAKENQIVFQKTSEPLLITVVT